MKKIYIYYPSEITGGAEFLLKTVCDFIKNSMRTCIVDIKDGWLSNNVSDVAVIYVNEFQKIYLDENSVLITTANLIRKLDLYFYGEFKIIAWMVQINNLTPAVPKIGSFQYNRFFKFLFKNSILNSEYKKIDKLTLYLDKSNSIYSMDEACNDVFYRYFKRKIDRYLPVVIPEEKFLEIDKIMEKPSDILKCVWVGRLDGEFKNPILHHILIEISEYAKINNKNIIFNVIGNGPGLKNAENIASSLEGIEINFLGERRGEELRRFICSHDMGFAMGTSALEISACGKPVVLLDASYGVVPKAYRYQWLYESKGYCIGRSIDTSPDKTLGNTKTIEDIFSELIIDGEKIRNLCYAHVRQYHSIDSLREKILIAIQQANSNFQEMASLNLFSKPYWYFIKRFIK